MVHVETLAVRAHEAKPPGGFLRPVGLSACSGSVTKDPGTACLLLAQTLRLGEDFRAVPTRGGKLVAHMTPEGVCS